MVEPSKIISDLADTIDTIIDKYQKRLPSSFDSTLGDLEDFVGTLERDARGNIKTSVKNLRAINKYAPKLKNDILKGEYGKTVDEFISEFNSVTKLSNQYFSALVGSEFASKEALYKEILEQNVLTTIDTLKVSGLKENVLNPIQRLLQQNVTGNAGIKEFKASLKQLLSEEGVPTRWVQQQATDALNQYNRNYIQTVSEDLGLEYYLYQGTKITTSRPFCVSRHGRYFTKEQVQSWGNLGDWQGKIKGTNSATIFTNCGGYNCRHSLIPVSESIYNAAKERGATGLR